MKRDESSIDCFSLMLNGIGKQYRGIYPRGFVPTPEECSIYKRCGFNKIVMENCESNEFLEKSGLQIILKPFVDTFKECNPFDDSYKLQLDTVLGRRKCALFWESPYRMDETTIQSLLKKGRLPIDLCLAEIKALQIRGPLIYKAPPEITERSIFERLKPQLNQTTFLLIDHADHHALPLLTLTPHAFPWVGMTSLPSFRPPLIDLSVLSTLSLASGGVILSVSKEETQRSYTEAFFYILSLAVNGTIPLKAYVEWLNQFEPEWLVSLPILLEFSSFILPYLYEKEETKAPSRRELTNHWEAKLLRLKKEDPQNKKLWDLLLNKLTYQ